MDLAPSLAFDDRIIDEMNQGGTRKGTRLLEKYNFGTGGER